jgi:serine/threonine-protein kinase
VNQPRATLAAGMQVTPSVRLVSPLGAGGMGAVWLADHTALNTRVVVKFMLDALDSSATARARFKREAEAASQVKSPHVVQTFDYGVTAEGVAFIVMEHLEGRDLAAEIAARGALEPRAVVAIVTQVSKALTKAHAVGLLHRDIKPDNIFLCHAESEDDRFVKLLDFGIAKAPPVEGESALDSQTKTGQVVGTPFYMSPEQVTAQKDIDLRSDLWALGVVTFEALTGKKPYDGPSFGALAVKIATGEPPRPSEANPALPASVDAWFAQACAREPGRRFASARELAERLRASFDGVVSLPPLPSGMTDSGPRDAQSGPRAKAAGPISVDDDAHERPSFVLASTAAPGTPSEPPERASLARSEGGAAVAIVGADADKLREQGRRSRRFIGVTAAVVLVGTTLGFALGRNGKDGRGATVSASGASGRSSAGFAEPWASAGTSASVSSVALTPSASGSSVALAPSVSLMPSASGPVPLLTASAVVDAGARAPAASSSRVGPVRPSASVSGTPVPSAVPSARPVPTGDPLY